MARLIVRHGGLPCVAMGEHGSAHSISIANFNVSSRRLGNRLTGTPTAGASISQNRLW